MRILLAEDEEMLAEAVAAFLSFHGHSVVWAGDGLSALEKAESASWDCLLLDIMMPGMDGISLLRRLRREGCPAPALFLTALDEIRDKIQAFESGGDDYMTKPFSMEELLLRINALARRGRSLPSELLQFSDLILELDACDLRVGSRSVALPHRELQLMAFLMRNPHHFFSADALLDRVWGLDAEVEQGTVWVHISNLRKKLDGLGSHALIQSRRGIGYALEESP